MFLGIEIGGTKLQLGVGPGDGELRGLWRGTVDPERGAAGIQQQITAAVPDLLAKAGVERSAIPRLVQIATADICHQTNPRPVTAGDFERLFAGAM